MKHKYLLFIGIILLAAGIMMRAGDIYKGPALILIISGAVAKISYIITKIRIGVYKPGGELIVLGVGLLLFFSGLHLRNIDHSFNYFYLMFPGLTLKIIFVAMFFRKINQKHM